MAGALGVALGGDASYHGQLKHKPVLGSPAHPVDKAALAQGLGMKTSIDSLVLSALAAGILLT
jgi:adenosylcobinamide-phosphate synthase